LYVIIKYFIIVVLKTLNMIIEKTTDCKTKYNSVIDCDVLMLSSANGSGQRSVQAPRWSLIISEHICVQLEILTPMRPVRFEHRSFLHKFVFKWHSGWARVYWIRSRLTCTGTWLSERMIVAGLREHEQ